MKPGHPHMRQCGNADKMVYTFDRHKEWQHNVMNIYNM